MSQMDEKWQTKNLFIRTDLQKKNIFHTSKSHSLNAAHEQKTSLHRKKVHIKNSTHFRF